MQQDLASTYKGRRVFAVLFGVVISLGGVLGLIIGTSPKIRHISLSGVTLFHPTPLSMALYGVVGAAVFLGVISGIVSILSQFDDAKV